MRALAIACDMSRDFGVYERYRALPVITGVRPERKARERGVHVLPRVRLEVSARGQRSPRRIETPMWLQGSHTLLVREGYEPAVETIVRMFAKGSVGTCRDDPDYAERLATELLGRGGGRQMHEELERRFEAYVRKQIGGELDVSVSITPKETPNESL